MKDLSNEVVFHESEGGFEFLQFRKLLEFGVKHAYTLKPHFFNTRPGVVNEERYEKSVKKANQTHTNCVKVVDKLPKNMCIEEGEYIDTDGLITNLQDVSIASCNADCILLLLYDPVKKVIGNVHSGWRGTFSKITVNGVQSMVNNYGCNPKDIIVCICPSIRKCCFEVKEDVKKLCEDAFSYTGMILLNI